VGKHNHHRGTSFGLHHYQKIDKYKQKYRDNIFVGKLPTDFTDWNILSVFIEGITMKTKLKQTKKKTMTYYFYQQNKFVGKPWTLFIMSITKGITNEKFCRYFSESSGTVHFLITLLITVLYRQNHRRIEKSSMLFDNFLRFFIKLNITDKITDGLKSHQWYEYCF
jgi:hypothetical protein